MQPMVVVIDHIEDILTAPIVIHSYKNRRLVYMRESDQK
jgi:hypothetical protein